MTTTSTSWPEADALQAMLLVPAAAAKGRDASDTASQEYCRLDFDAKSGLIRLIAACRPPPDARNNNKGEAEVQVLDEIDPADVIGAELEICFPGIGDGGNKDSDAAEGKVTTSRVWVGSLSSKRNLATAIVGYGDDDDDDDDADEIGEYESGRASPASASGAASLNDDDEDDIPILQAAASGDLASNNIALPPIPSEGEVPVAPRRNNRNGAVAFLNIYCYPRPTKDGGGIWGRIFGGGNSNDKSKGQDKGQEKQSSSATTTTSAPINPDPTKDLPHRRAHHRRYEVAPTEDFASVRSVVRAVRNLATLGGHFENKQQKQSRRYLVVVNPYSGTGQGETIYNTTVKPMLDQAGVVHDVCVTQWGGHAMERMAKWEGKASGKGEDGGGKNEPDCDIAEYDAVIAMGGDGILFEMLQGIMARSDADEVLSKLSIGIVGCGTSNGLAKSILHQSMEKYSPLESTFLICKGRTAHVDLSRYETITGKKYTGFLTFSWAFIADVDLDSECIRFLGVARNDVWAAYRILVNRSYRAKFSYLPESAADGVSGAKVAATLPPLSVPVPTDKGWKTIEGDFILFWASQVTHAAYNTFQSPLSQMQDGLFRIMVVRKPISRLAMIQIALAIETGHHVHHDQCEMYECVAFRLEPLKEEGKAAVWPSHNDLDGEKIECGPIQACVLPSAARFFSGVMS